MILFIRKRILQLLILILYSALVVSGGLSHEPWRDEAHVWYTVRENSITTLFYNARYERVQILWNLILFPFAKLGFPYVTMTLVHILIAIVAVALILFLGKLPIFTKILFIFSYYMAYEYAVIARNYVVMIFLLFAIASIYSQRMIRPWLYGFLIFLLYQVNVYSLVPAGIFSLFFSIEMIAQKKVTFNRVMAVVTMGIGALIALFQLLATTHVENTIDTNRNNILQSTVVVLNNIIIPASKHYFDPSPPLFWLSVLYYSVIALLILFFIYISRNFTVFLMSAMTFAYLFYMNLVAHNGSQRHHGLFLIFILFFLWIFHSKRYPEIRFFKGVEIFLLVLLSLLSFISIFFTATIYAFDYQYPFSGAKDMAEYIKSHDLERMTIVSYQGGFGEAVLPYLKNKQFYFPEFKAKGVFDLNDIRYYALLNNTSMSDATIWVSHYFSNRDPILLLWSKPLSDDLLSDWKLLHTSLSVYFWGQPTDDFYLYANGIAMKKISHREPI